MFFIISELNMKAFDREKLKDAIYDSVRRVYNAQNSNVDLYRNTVDCFSASIDALAQGISLDGWLEQERDRQIQKTKQNAIGSLHEEIMGSIDGVENLCVGNVFDILSNELNIIAEVKNKHNTTKGNHKVQIYRDLAAKLAEPKYDRFTAYYVEVLPKNGQSYNEPFIPSDNILKRRMPKREDIRVIDGYSFYALLTGHRDALEELYNELPYIVAEIFSELGGEDIDPNLVVNSDIFSNLFDKVYN
jgi:hypothetical protein